MANQHTMHVATTTINEEGPWLGVETDVLATLTYTTGQDGLGESRYAIHDQLKDRPYCYYSKKKAITDRSTRQVVAQDFPSVKEARRFVYSVIGTRHDVR